MAPTFCRHSRFVERCPICRETVPGFVPERQKPPKREHQTPSRGAAAGGGGSRPVSGASRSRGRVADLRVRRERRFADDGYRCQLVPGIHSSQDAGRLVQEIGFAGGRLVALGTDPPELYAAARECEDIEQATWICFIAAYLSPLQGEEPFAGIRQALVCDWASGEVPALEDVPLGPRTSHDPRRGAQTLVAYRRFAEHAGSQQRAFAGEPEWTAQRRFERVFERLALPGFGRTGRFDLLTTLAGLGLYELRADSLHLSIRPGVRTAPGAGVPAAAEQATMAAAKRVFGIGDPGNIERRAAALAEATGTPLEALDLALFNWGAPPAAPPAYPPPGTPTSGPDEERVTLGFPAGTSDAQAIERAERALGL